MTEQQWLAATDPTPMLRFLQGRMSSRKLRLLNCAIIRSAPVGLEGDTMWELISRRPWFRQHTWAYEMDVNRDVVQTQELITLSCHEAVEIVERAADATGLEALSASAAFATFAACYAAEGEMFGQSFTPTSEYDYRLTQCFAILARPANEVTDWIIPASDHFRLPVSEDCHPTICALSRDTFGNPFRPVSVNPAWLTSDVRTLAEGVYQDRAFDRMPILADVLQDAGCDNDDILNHCRGNGPHVRGCWVVDLLLGKS